AAMVERLRADPGALGMVSGAGMHMTKHVYGVYSTAPARLAPPAAVAAPDAVPVVDQHDASAVVAAYSIVHDRDGTPGHALLVCALPDGARAYARTDDPDLCAGAEQVELVGEEVVLESVRVDGPFGPATVNRAARQRRV